MTPEFNKAFEIVVSVEGGLSLDPDDRGNWDSGKVGVGNLKGTRYGISAMSYPNEDIEHLPLDRAKLIYVRDFWFPVRAGELTWPLSLCLFDSVVQHDAPGQARTTTKILQESLGLRVDGDFGPKTMAAVRAKPTIEVSANFMRIRSNHYRAMHTYDRYGNGWINRLFTVALKA